MAKNQEALLQEVVGQLRMLNKSSVRDRLRESEEAKRAEKLAVTTDETSAITGTMIDSATDFQRRYLAGQAKTFTDKALSNKPTGFEQDRQGITLNAVNFQLEAIKNTLSNQLTFWHTLLNTTQQELDITRDAQITEKKWRLDQLRAANEARLESIQPALAGVGGAGVLALPDKTGEGEGEGEGGGISALGASGLTLAALAVWKKIKLGMKFIFGLPGKIGFALKSAGKLIFAKFLATKSGKPFLKNIGRIRAWPIILAAMVANSFYSGIKSAFSDDEAGGNPQQDTATAEDQSMLDKVLDNNVLMTGLDVWLGYSVANWLTKGRLGAGIAAVARAAWSTAKAGRLGFFLTRALMMAGGAAVGLSAPVWGSILAAGLIAYHWDSISGALKNSWNENFGAIGTATTPGGMTAELAAKITDPIKAGDFPVFNPDGPGGATLIAGQDQQLTEMFKRIKNGGNAEIASKMLYDGLVQAGHNPERIKKLARAAGINFSWVKPGAHHAGMPIPDFAAYEARKRAELKAKLLANVSGMQGALRNVASSRLSSRLDGKDGDGIIAPYLSQSGRILAQEMQGARERFDKRISGDGIFTNNAMGTASGNVTIAPVDASTTSTVIQNYNAYEPTWGGATSEAYERHTSFGGNGAGNWF
jgi:hypothetical protein